MDDYLEESFKRYQERHGQTTDSGRKRKRRRVGDEVDGELEGQGGGGADLPENRFDSRYSDAFPQPLRFPANGRNGRLDKGLNEDGGVE